MSKVNLLVDGDILIYWIAHRHQDITAWDDNIVSVHCDLSKAIVDLDYNIKFVKEAVGDCDLHFAFSCPTSEGFRKALYAPYKDNRSPKNVPVGYSKVKEHIVNTYGSVTYPRLEADDIIAILSDDLSNPIIFSADKDFKQLGLPMINPYNIDAGIDRPSTEEATRHFYEQVLSGDRADNFPGCPGVGVIGAAKLLKKCESEEEMWEKIVEAFDKKGLTEDDAILNARMAYLLRSKDYNKDTGEIILWNPKK